MNATLRLIAVALMSATIAVSGATPAQPDDRVVAYEGGRWFRGDRFVPAVGYVEAGVLSFRRPARIDARVNLLGGYVVAPFAEAHNHNVESSTGSEARLARYLEHGIFYVKNPNSLPRDRPAIAARVNTPTSIDATFANGGWTGVDGHPSALVRRNIARNGWTEADGDGGFYWTAASEEELAAKWPTYLAQRPQFVKAYLLFSEEFERRRDDTKYVGWKGLDPRLLPALVRRAHDAGLRVTVHVETAADFRTAVQAGADEIAHLPGFRGDMEREMSDPARFEIPEADAKLAATRGTTVITTVSGATQVPADGPQAAFRQQLDALYRRNLRMLHRHGVRLAIGSDRYNADASDEALYLHALGVFSPLELLRLWTTTARTIFPDRRIGVLEEGAEASFVVLARNPLEDFTAVRAIQQRVKQGVLLPSPPPAMMAALDERRRVIEAVLDFFRPPRGQARWLDRTWLVPAGLDAPPDVEVDAATARAVIASLGEGPFCLADAKAGCRASRGGRLQISEIYSSGAGTARVVAAFEGRWPPAPARPAGQQIFVLHKDANRWRIVDRLPISAGS